MEVIQQRWSPTKDQQHPASNLHKEAIWEPAQELSREVGGAFSSVSSLLGGSTEGKKGKPDTVSRAKTVKAVLDFAEASQRFWSRTPRGQPNNGNGS
ncbi:hypothetical protein GB937_010720 [Aspergillus fischeri]|nr:hypothetical protein GB937_010720 [Aspergillus fischeri]